MKRIDWNSETWGQAGHNVHVAENGSHVPSAHGQEQDS